jgi:acyl-CoA thioesterase-2
MGGTGNEGGPSTAGPDDELAAAIDHALDALLAALQLEPVGEDRFRVAPDLGRFAQVFGGQVLAQAIVAASATVEGKDPHSLHAYFVEAGVTGEPLEVEVDRVRDGRSFATRRVSVHQGDRELLTAIASFHANPEGLELATPAPSAPAPDELPLLQAWAADPVPERAELGRGWIDRPPPIEMRMTEGPSFLGRPHGMGPRAHWMRLPRPVGDDPVLHAALLAYASDFFLLDMAFRARPSDVDPLELTGISLDHSIWFHRPVHFDRWHLYTHEAVAVSGHRGLVRGSIHDEAGHLVASAVQETLVRPAR